MPVVGEQGLVFVEIFREAAGEVLRKSSSEATAKRAFSLICAALSSTLTSSCGQAVGKITVYATRSVVGGVRAQPDTAFVGINQVCAHVEGVEHHRQFPIVETVAADPE